MRLVAFLKFFLNSSINWTTFIQFCRTCSSLEKTDHCNAIFFMVMPIEKYFMPFIYLDIIFFFLKKNGEKKKTLFQTLRQKHFY